MQKDGKPASAESKQTCAEDSASVPNTEAPLLVSACLLGAACRYDGGAKPCEQVLRAAAHRPMIPVCPEQLGGLPTPRPPAERVNGRVMACTGADVTEQYARGAAEALRLAETFGCRTAILKERSPSCGHGTIYDGSFTGALCAGDGVTAELLRQHGLQVYGESDAAALFDLPERDGGE